MMGYQPYHTPEPERPQGTRWLLWLGIAVVLLFLLGICLIGAFLLARQFQQRTAVPPTLVIPTSLAATVAPATTDISLAATATLRATAAATDLPIGPGNVEAGQLTAPPTMDGDLSEWGLTTTTESTFLVHNADGWDSTDDVTAVWRLAWDANNLYVAVAVTDDTHVQTQSGNQIFRGDSVDIQLDTDRNGDYGDGLSPDDFQFILSPGDFAGLSPSAFRFQGTNNGRILDAPGHAVSLAAQKTAQGYNLEAAIPWRDLDLTPASGLVIGLALNVNDNDTPGTAVQEVMKSHVASRSLTDPTGWGTLTLK